MLFEVYRGNVGLMQTDSAKCVYDRAQLLVMQQQGHKFKLDGKAASVQQVCAVIAENKKGR